MNESYALKMYFAYQAHEKWSKKKNPYTEKIAKGMTPCEAFESIDNPMMCYPLSARTGLLFFMEGFKENPSLTPPTSFEERRIDNISLEHHAKSDLESQKETDRAYRAGLRALGEYRLLQDKLNT